MVGLGESRDALVAGPRRAGDHLHGQIRRIHPRQDHVLGPRPMGPTCALEDLPFSFEGARLGRHKRGATEHAGDVVVRRTAIPDAKDFSPGSTVAEKH